MNSSFSTRERLDGLSERMSRLGGLLRARVEVQIEEQNRDLLASMDRRAQMQFRLQYLVEGVSVVAITYYLLGLVRYGLDGVNAGIGIAIDTVLATGVALPLVLGLVWLGLRRARRAVESDRDN